MENFVMHYHIKLTENLRKAGYTGNNQRTKKGEWKRVNGLKNQYKKLGFNAELENVYIREKDIETLAIEQVAHAYMGAKGLHAGNQEIHGPGWTEIFSVSQKQLQGYLGMAVKTCKKLDWNIKRIINWLLEFCWKNFGTWSWPEKCYGYPPSSRPSSLEAAYSRSLLEIDKAAIKAST